MRHQFLPGINVLLRRHKDWVAGRRLGLVSHLAAVTREGMTSAERLWNESGLCLKALFGPEHGFFGTAMAGTPMSHQTHPEWRIPIYSLYGRSRKPTTAMFQNLDVILVDLQDIGARPYTYVSTLRYVLEKAAELNKPVVIADRPVPLPRGIDGPVLDPAFESFVGCVRSPMLYGMTPGEMALWLKADLRLNLEVRVARMEHYHRQAARGPDWPPWIPPSQGIRSWESAMCYLATIFAEALPAINNGRSSNLAFQVFGAPWMKSRPVCKFLNNLWLPGVTFYSHPYTVTTADKIFDGVRIVVRNPDVFCPVFTGLSILYGLQTLYGRRRVWKHPGTQEHFFDKLYGTDSVRKALLNGAEPSMIRRRWAGALRAFHPTRTGCLLYRPGGS